MNLALKKFDEEPAYRDKVYEALKEAIINMELYSSREPQWIDERKISEQLGVSRTPAREVKPCWRRGFRHLNPT
jgi:DNA-binding GntR family transcriptional regulator